MVEKKRIIFSVGSYCTLLLSRKEEITFSEVALVAFYCKCLISCIMIARRCRTLDTTNTTADIYLLVENGHENNETKRSLFKLIKKFTRTIDCRLSS